MNSNNTLSQILKKLREQDETSPYKLYFDSLPDAWKDVVQSLSKSLNVVKYQKIKGVVEDDLSTVLKMRNVNKDYLSLTNKIFSEKKLDEESYFEMYAGPMYNALKDMVKIRSELPAVDVSNPKVYKDIEQTCFDTINILQKVDEKTAVFSKKIIVSEQISKLKKLMLTNKFLKSEFMPLYNTPEEIKSEYVYNVQNFFSFDVSDFKKNMSLTFSKFIEEYISGSKLTLDRENNAELAQERDRLKESANVAKRRFHELVNIIRDVDDDISLAYVARSIKTSVNDRAFGHESVFEDMRFARDVSVAIKDPLERAKLFFLSTYANRKFKGRSQLILEKGVKNAEEIYECASFESEYKFIKILGKGAYATTYLAYSKTLDQYRAIKILNEKNLDNQKYSFVVNEDVAKNKKIDQGELFEYKRHMNKEVVKLNKKIIESVIDNKKINPLLHNHSPNSFELKTNNKDYYDLLKDFIKAASRDVTSDIFEEDKKEAFELKITKINPDNEAQTQARIDQDKLENIAIIHDAGEGIVRKDGSDNKLYAIVMEYVDGPSIRELMNEGPLNEDLAVNYASQMLNAVRTLEMQGISHRDLHPDNMRVNSKGVLKLLDFGIATSENDAIAEKNRKYGPPEGMPASDKYSIGMIFYEMLKGYHPISPRKKSENTEMFAEKIKLEKKYKVYTPKGRIKKQFKRKIIDDVGARYASVVLTCFDNYRTVQDAINVLSVVRRDIDVYLKNVDELRTEVLSLREQLNKYESGGAI